MRVLTVGNRYPPHGVGGYERVWRSLVTHLRARGDDVRVLCTDVRDGDPNIGEDEDVHRELRWGWEDLRWRELTRREAGEIEAHNRDAFARHVRLMRPDAVVWMNMGGVTLRLLEDARDHEIPALGVVHDGWLVYGPDVDPGTRLRRPLWRFRPAGLARWTFNSEFTRSATVAARGVAPDSPVVYPGVDPRLFAPVPLAGSWGGRLLVVGRVSPEKGIEVALRAVAALNDTSLRIVGPGEDSGFGLELRHISRSLRIDPRVAFTGAASGATVLAEAYADCDAVLFPVTWDEPFGLVPLEAMAVGRPVIATGTGGSAEYLVDGENALIVAPGDSDALAAAVRRLQADPTLRSRLTDAGRVTAARFTEDRCTTGLAALLDETVAAGLRA